MAVETVGLVGFAEISLTDVPLDEFSPRVPQRFLSTTRSGGRR